MPFNLAKVYDALLEIDHYPEMQRTASLRGIFRRDIEHAAEFQFRNRNIYPTKSDRPAMDVLFEHLTTHESVKEDPDGKTYKTRTYESERSKRLHWVRHHIEEKESAIDVFSVEERIGGRDVIRTYIYNAKQKYLVILEPQKSDSYYLITAYYLDRPEGPKTIQKKQRKKLAQVY